MAPPVQTGLQRFLDDPSCAQLVGRRVGILANPTAVSLDLTHIVECLGPLCEVVALFGPEHGVRGDAQDMISVSNYVDATGAKVFSLYGTSTESLRPTAESLADIDVMVFDIQDIGARYYTYVWTMVLAMRACAKAGVDFVVFDRPNPIGGHTIEGPPIAPGYESFVGLCQVPNRHGLTAGEIACWIHQSEGLDLHLTVVTMRGWRRSMTFAETELPWVQPSPNMPTYDTALVYPGMCLVEGTALSEGRGTTRPFEIAGAPFIDPMALSKLLTEQQLPGVRFRPVSFTPMFQKHAGVLCHGVQQHVDDHNSYLPFKTGVAFVWAVHRLYPKEFAWRTQAYEFVDSIPAFDLLTGSSAIREGIEDGLTLADLADIWDSSLDQQRQEWRDRLLYPPHDES